MFVKVRINNNKKIKTNLSKYNYTGITIEKQETLKIYASKTTDYSFKNTS